MHHILSRRSRLVSLIVATLLSAQLQAREPMQLDIPAQPLSEALRQLGTTSNTNIIFEPGMVRGMMAPAVKGTITTQEALLKLLDGTPWSFKFVDENTVSLVPASEKSASVVDLQEVTVTGSRIKGARPSSTVLTITPEEMRLAGQNNLGEVIRAIPQNFNGGQNPSVAFNTGGDPANTNISGGSSINLRGLGPDATLVLLNGSRLPYDGVAQAVDISVIPTAAIERVEVLLDGASAIYGSDAVGGVANIQLKRDYDGAELSVRYGEATDGGFVQNQYSGVIGTTWQSGGVLLAGDSSSNTALRARQRDYLSYLPNRDYTIYPQLQQESALLSGHQQLGASVELTLDAFYTERQQDMMYQLANLIRQQRNSTLWGIAPAIRFQLPADWSVRVHGALGENDFDLYQKDFSRTTGAQLARYGSRYANDSQAAGIEMEGPLLALPAGMVRMSLGGGYRRNELVVLNLITGVKGTHGSDRSRYGYGEIDVPLVSPAQAVPMVEHLSFNGAVRYENYDSFGETTTPKFGINWGVVPGVELKANWGKSFKVPTLYQQNALRNLVLYPGSVFGASSTDVMMLSFGGAPDLQPERAEILTAGITLTPMTSLSLEAGWFDIDYSDRVIAPLPYTAQALNDISYSDFVTFDPSVAEQNALFAEMGLPAGTFTGNFTGAPYDPSNIYALLRNHYANAAAQRISGFDAMARYTRSLFGGSLATSLSATWIDSHRRLSSQAPEQAAAGRVFFMSKFKARLGASWSRDALTVASYVVHIDGVKDTRIAPTLSGASWTTVDLVFDYQLQSAMVGGIGINLAVTNVFNREPPLMRHLTATDVNYDSTNYSPLGRVWNATLTKRF
ncbi:TonB-dependent receptor [Steroidobacter sp.]|uniref:TonB-dependent receptor n=1 Tax=Steroidobacter sp. TaxID=1978227 RepID=UPI001A4AB87E|nr:TonB-dependent receptor [Steroidobacter sp.]MBL8265674.1 TonB-dependent receptor [Steroidobacter sp.]